MLIMYGVIFIVIVLFLFEYRIKRPDQIVLVESKGIVRKRKTRIYPRHFSLCIPGIIYSVSEEIQAEAKGHLLVKIQIAISVTASKDNLAALIQAGGWSNNTISQAIKELKIKIEAITRVFTGKYNIENFSTEEFSKYMETQLININKELGLDILSITIQSIEPTDEKIVEAIRQCESARIMEQTEIANQMARISSAKAKLEADEKIASFDHSLELKKYGLQKITEEKEAQLAHKRIEEEVALRQMQIEVEKKEIELLVKNPEILLLTPQVARLAEASQNLRNARTVVSLSGNELADGSQLPNILKSTLQNILGVMEKKEK